MKERIKIVEAKYKEAKSIYNKNCTKFTNTLFQKSPQIFDKKENLTILRTETLYHQQMMTKKEFMLEIINFLPDWQMGRGLKALIENNQLSPEVFEKLYEIFKQTMHETYTEVQKVEFKEKLLKIEAMKQQEAKQTEEELINLDEMLNAL